MPLIESLELATVLLPDWHPEIAARGTRVKVFGYLIDHPDGPIIFDTGVGSGHTFIDQAFRPTVTSIDVALSRFGVETANVVAVVNSHLHFDHCGQNVQFHGLEVPIFSQQAELDLIERDGFYTITEWATPPPTQRRPVDGDQEIAEGVTVLATPGHTPGHQSVVVESAEGRVVLAGQAVWHSNEFVNVRATESNVVEPSARPVAIDSIRRLKSLSPDVVYFSHCSALHLDSI